MVKALVALLLCSAPVLADGYKPPELTKYTMPSGHVRIFAEEDLRGLIGNEAYEDFRASQMTLNDWIVMRNTESLALTVGEIAAFTLSAVSLWLAVEEIAEGPVDCARSACPDHLQAGLIVGGAGLLLGGTGALLVWIDLQDYGVIRNPEFELKSARGGGLALAFAF